MRTNFLRFFNDKAWRKQWLRYWLSDPFWGGLDYFSHYVLRYLPVSVNASVGAFLGPLAAKYRFKIPDGRARDNLAILRPDLGVAEREKMLTRMWQNIGQSMSEYSLLDKIYAQNRVSIINGDYLQPFIGHKQAVIFVFAHTGNWEICGNYVIGYGFDVMGLYKPVRNRFASRIADAARERMGGAIKLIISGPSSMRLICKHLADKGALWIAIDEVKKNQVNVPSFGRKPQTGHSNLSFAVRLAQRYNAAIIPVWTRREAPSRYSIRLGPPMAVAAGDDAFEEAFANLDHQLETWLMANLEQWYMLHSFRL
ncbi:lysophospholipid acyltransferase family protein [Methylovulum miyakonense]|uniref:lysophospholipid acyltransferase family protein n=1 Tax=Methylovulum miyakonense TaxID=645578 RepID=UPI000374509B|nr:hypothetical protein [Methylovulum miyakonense]